MDKGSISQVARERFLNQKNEAWLRVPKDKLCDFQQAAKGKVCEAPMWRDEFLYEDSRNDQPFKVIRLKGGEHHHWACEVEAGRLDRYIVVVESGACILDECLTGSSGARSVEVLVKKGAKLSHFYQNSVIGGFDHLSITLEAGAEYAQEYAILGQGYSRRAMRVILGDESQARIRGMLLAKAAQAHLSDVVDLVVGGENVVVSHEVKTLLGERAKVDVYSHVEIPKACVGAQTHQAIQHLLLSKYATVFSKPAMSIHTDEVVCEHGAFSQMLDDRLLFYMHSRGLDDIAAKALYLDGYINTAYQQGGSLVKVAKALFEVDCVESS